jgi:hypothetical protein
MLILASLGGKGRQPFCGGCRLSFLTGSHDFLGDYGLMKVGETFDLSLGFFW